MTFSSRMEDGCLIVNVQGRLDTLNAPDLIAGLEPLMGQANSMVLDLDGLEYISSAGLRALLMVHKTMAHKGGLTVVHAGELVTEVLQVTGFYDVLHIVQ